jgi:alpha-tubulin suppressor-like RCC1 family protein
MFHTCAIKTNGTPVCWGDNAYNMSSIPAGTGTVTQIAAGMYHTCVVKTNGTTVCWGYGGFNSVPYPDGARTAPIKISAGALYTCAVKGDGTPTCWGDNGSGQSSIPDGTGTVTQMVAGVNHSCAIRTDGTPTCWGNNDSGQSSIPDGTGTVTQIIAGNNFTCAIKTNGNPTCWGANDVGETAIPAGIGTVKQIAAGFSTSCAIKTDGTPVCWGDGENGQTAIPGDIGAVTQIAVGDWHVCAIKADGTPVCWGSNYFGQLNIPAGIGTVTQLRSDDFHTCAVTVDSHAVCWGTDYWGQSTVPDGIDTVSQVAAGFYHSCVVETSGQAKCWGYNGYGQSGGPATFSSADPSATIQMEDYSFTFTAGGGPGATFDLASGNLPPGLALSSTGALTGTPTTRGTYTFTVRASNGIFADGAQEVTLKVEAPTPSAPTLHSTYPDSPSNATEIAIIGDAQPDSTVKLYASDDCTGSPVATDTAWNYDFWLWVTVGADTSTSFTAIATNPDDKTSPCSSVITYVNDSTAPTAPTALAIVPDSPSQSADVTISGGAESGSTVNLYANAECSGYPVQTGDASDFADGFTVTAPSDASTFFTANASDAAGNTSGCSSAVSYTNDSTAPDAPSALSASPVSPSASAAVTIKGVAEAGTSVDLYDNSTCSGSPVETGDANAFATGFAVTATLNAETAYAVTATDAAGNTSECSDAVLFVNDSTPPPAPFAIAIEPKSPANPSALKVSGHADGGTTVRLYANASCSGAPAATGTAADFATGFETTATSNMSVYAATATDGVGNTSPCSSAAGFEVLKSGTFVKPTLKTKHKGSRLIFSASIRLSGAGISPETCLGTVKAVLQRSRGNKAFPSSTTKSGLAKLGWNGSACVAKLSVSKSARYTTKGVKVKTTLSVHSPSLAVPPMVFVKKF